MSQTDSTALAGKQKHRGSSADSGDGSTGGGSKPPVAVTTGDVGGSGGLFRQYKPEQGKNTRVGTFVAAGALIAWGAMFLYDRLAVYEGDEAWRLLVTIGIPMAAGVMLGGIAWWAIFTKKSSSDFMIATEGEMKKVNWSSKREVIGSTKVVIAFTLLMAVMLFLIDVAFQALFTWIGVLKVINKP